MLATVLPVAVFMLILYRLWSVYGISMIAAWGSPGGFYSSSRNTIDVSVKWAVSF